MRRNAPQSWHLSVLVQPPFPWGAAGGQWWTDPRPPQYRTLSRAEARRARRELAKTRRMQRQRISRETRRVREREIFAAYADGKEPKYEEGARTFRLSRRTRESIKRVLRERIEVARAELNDRLAGLTVDEWCRSWTSWSEQEDRRYERIRDERLAELWPAKSPEERRAVAEWARALPTDKPMQGPRP